MDCFVGAHGELPYRVSGIPAGADRWPEQPEKLRFQTHDDGARLLYELGYGEEEIEPLREMSIVG